MSIELIQYTSYTDASNRAGNSLCENWKHQWIFGESKLKPSNLLHIFSSDLSKAKFINSQADLHCLKKAARGSQTYRHGINRSMDGNIWASPFRTMDAVPSPIASVASASWCRRCYVVFFVGWCETEPFVFPWVDIFSVGRILKRTPVFFLLFYFWFLYDKLQNHILDCTYFLRCLVNMVLLHVLGLCYSFVERKNGPR